MNDAEMELFRGLREDFRDFSRTIQTALEDHAKRIATLESGTTESILRRYPWIGAVAKGISVAVLMFIAYKLGDKELLNSLAGNL